MSVSTSVPVKRGLRHVLPFSLLLIAAAIPPSALAQAQAAAPVAAYDLPAGPLGRTLAQVATQAGIALSFDPALTEGRNAPAVRGELTALQALDQLLAGSGLERVIRADGSHTLRPAPHGDGALLLSPVRIEGRTGSTDAAATEGERSYAARAATIGRTAQSLREIPQSVTVMTRQLIEDQRLDTIDDLMTKAPGIVVSKDSAGYSGFWSRGFQVDNYQLDGVAVAYSSIYRPNVDLALYDRVEVLRGADGLFSGTGEAGGSINLVRKRPLEAQQVQFSGSISRWNNFRSEMDISTPLGFDGKLRGRAVAVFQDRDYFYSPADERKTLLYGIVEADVGARTVLLAGASRQQDEGVNWYTGLPRYTDGSDIGFPRDRALIFDWAVRDNTTLEYFVGAEHRLPGDWLIKATATRQEFDTQDYMAFVSGPIDPDTQTPLGFVGGSYEETGNKADAFDVHVAGSFEWLGREHRVVAGGDWQESKAAQIRYRLVRPDYGAPGSIWDFDPSAYPPIGVGSAVYGWPAYGAKQQGFYGKLQAELTDRLRVIAGGRYSRYEYHSPDYEFAEDGTATLTYDTYYRETGILTPYGGIVFDLSAAWTAYASMAEIHKSQAGRLQGPLPGTPLDAITGRNHELGIKGELLDGRFNTSLALYRIEREGEAVDDPAYPPTDGERGLACCFLAQGEVISEGVDAEFSGELSTGWQLLLGYTYNRNENKSTSAAYHALTPRHLFKAWTTYKLPGAASAWSVGGGVTAQSDRSNTGRYWGSGAWRSFEIEQGGYAVWQAQAGYRFDEQWSLALNVNNVFDKLYYQTLGTPSNGNWYGEPVSWALTLRGRF